MESLRSRDGRYLAVEQDDSNLVVYDGRVAVWDRWSYEAGSAAPPGPTPLPAAGASTPRLIRVTLPEDGQIIPRGYSYWANAFREETGHVLVFCGIEGQRPQLFRVHPPSGAVYRLGSVCNYDGTSEGWYFDREGWIYLTAGSCLRRVHPFSGEDRLVHDIATTFPGCDIWQAHSSDDGTIHSMTVRQPREDGPYLHAGTLLVTPTWTHYLRALKPLDESQITADGKYLVIKEGDDNRIVTVATGEERWIKDLGRAVGHSDCGASFVVGEADKPDPGGCVVWDLTQPLTIDRCRFLFPTLNMGYVAVRGAVCLHSSNTAITRLDLHTGAATVLVEYPDTGNDYDRRVKANLSPCGRWGCFTREGIVYLVEIPA